MGGGYRDRLPIAGYRPFNAVRARFSRPQYWSRVWRAAMALEPHTSLDLRYIRGLAF